MRKPLISSNAPKAIGPYSHGFKFDSLVFTSGQLGMNAVSGEFAGSTIEAQTKACFENLVAVLTEGGSKLTNVIKVTVYIKDMNDFAAVNKIYGEYFTSNFLLALALKSQDFQKML